MLINGSPGSEEKNQKYIDELKAASAKIPGEKFGIVDGVCHSELLSVFDIMEDDFPALIYINSKFEKFTRLIGGVQTSSI